MTATIIPFLRPPKLGRGERPKRSDADRLRDLDAPKGQTIGEFFGGDTSLIDFAKQGGPKESA